MKELLENLDWRVLTITVGSFIPLFFVTCKNKGEGQNFCTCILWFILDVFQINLRWQQGSEAQSLFTGLAFGTSILCILLLIYKQVLWREFHTRVSLAILAALFFSSLVEKDWQIIFFVLAQLFSNTSLVRNIWRKPHMQTISFFSHIGFLSANILVIYQAPIWTVPYIFYSACFAGFESVIILRILYSKITNRITIRRYH